MRTFSEVAEALDLKPWLRGHVGQLHLPRTYARSNPVVRHFDTPDIAGLVESYVEVVSEFERWVAARPEVSELVEIQPITEVGIDFVARPHHVYHVSLADYDDPDQAGIAEEVASELASMRDRVEWHLKNDPSGRDRILQEVVVASLLDPSPVTIMGGDRFLVVSPVVAAEQLQRWASATNVA